MQELLRFIFVLKPKDGIVRVAYDDDVALRLLPPWIAPLVEHVVQVHVGKQRRDHRSLWRALLRLRPFAFLDHSRVEPFSDPSQDSRIGDPPPDHSHQVLFFNVIEKAFQVHVEYPVHLLPSDRHIQRVQRPMWAASGPEPVGESPKVFLVDLVEDRDHRALDNLVFQRRDSQRPWFAVGLQDVDSPRGRRSIRSAVDPAMQIFQSILQPGLILFPCHAVHSGRRLTFESVIAVPQQVDRHMVEQCGELFLFVLPRSLAHTI